MNLERFFIWVRLVAQVVLGVLDGLEDEPGMGIDLEVQVLLELGHRNQSEPQGVQPRGGR